MLLSKWVVMSLEKRKTAVSRVNLPVFEMFSFDVWQKFKAFGNLRKGGTFKTICLI